MIIQQQLLLPSHPQFINQALLWLNVVSGVRIAVSWGGGFDAAS